MNLGDNQSPPDAVRVASAHSTCDPVRIFGLGVIRTIPDRNRLKSAISIVHCFLDLRQRTATRYTEAEGPSCRLRAISTSFPSENQKSIHSNQSSLKTNTARRMYVCIKNEFNVDWVTLIVSEFESALLSSLTERFVSGSHSLRSQKKK